MASAVIKELLRRAPALDPAEVDDVILGCAFPEGEQGMNMARMVEGGKNLALTLRTMALVAEQPNFQKVLEGQGRVEDGSEGVME